MICQSHVHINLAISQIPLPWSSCMIEAPLVSVLIPAFNHEDFVQDTLNSIIAQTYKHLELILINDGSSDQTHDRIVELHDVCKRHFTNFIYINQPNYGIAYCQNEGIKRAKGKYLFFSASDDIIHPKAISILVGQLENRDESYALACGDSDYIDSNQRRIYLDYIGKPHHEAHPAFFSTFVSFRTRHREYLDLKDLEFGSYQSLLLGNYIPVGLLVKRNALFEAGLYNEDFIIQDLDMWFKISKNHKMIFENKILSHYRLHGNNTVTRQSSLIKKSNLELLLREKEYSYACGYQQNWNLGFLSILLKGPLKLTYDDFFSYFKHLQFGDLLKSMPRYLINEILRITNIVKCLHLRWGLK